MTARRYIVQSGIPQFVEVAADVDGAEVERELHRIYGTSFRLGRFIRRGKRRRAEVISDENDPKLVSYNGNWLGGSPLV
jgi:hypothetical protein